MLGASPRRSLDQQSCGVQVPAMDEPCLFVSDMTRRALCVNPLGDCQSIVDTEQADEMDWICASTHPGSERLASVRGVRDTLVEFVSQSRAREQYVYSRAKCLLPALETRRRGRGARAHPHPLGHGLGGRRRANRGCKREMEGACAPVLPFSGAHSSQAAAVLTPAEDDRCRDKERPGARRARGRCGFASSGRRRGALEKEESADADGRQMGRETGELRQGRSGRRGGNRKQ